MSRLYVRIPILNLIKIHSTVKIQPLTTNFLTKSHEDGLAAEYVFDYGKAKPNRFAVQERKTIVVVLDEDVSQVFSTSEAVNKALRALIEAMP